MKNTIGRCSNCGGAVTVPESYMSIVPPVPTCERCGATAKPRGPVIQMDPPPRRDAFEVDSFGEQSGLLRGEKTP